MTKSYRFALLTGAALPVLLAHPGIGAAQMSTTATPAIVVAQADALAAAQAEVAAAQAALEQAMASGGDVAAAQARLDAALNALAAAQAAGEAPAEPPAPPQPETPRQPEPQSDAQPEPETPPAPVELPAKAEPVAPPASLAPPPELPAAPQIEPPVPPANELPLEEPQPVEPPVEEPPAPQDPPAPQEQPPAPQEPVREPPQGDAEQQVPPVQGQPAPTANESPPPRAPTPPAQRPRADQGQPATPSASRPEEVRTQPPAEAPPEESPVESQLEAQGDNEGLENVRSLREKLRNEFARGNPDEGEGATRPDDGRDANRDGGDQDGRTGDDRERDGRRGEDRDRRDGDRRHRDRPSDDGDIVLDFGLGFVVELGDQLVIRRDEAYETERFLDRARDVDVEHFRGGYTRTVVTRHDGTRIYTVRNRYGDIITRTRVTPNGRQVVLIDNRDFYRDGRRPRYSRFDDLPPLRLDIPREQYIVETSRYDRDGIRTALLAPPVDAVERPYALEEIRTSQRLRDKLRRVDLNTITFDFGSAAISPSQFDALSEVGWAIETILAESPNELFLIEGHTDAVGAPTDNLVLSDRRAEAIAVALSSNFAIPPENLVTQGYGEQYLKIPTAAAERENRRVTVRRITPLVNQAGLPAQ